jgi:hypothetical protein
LRLVFELKATNQNKRREKKMESKVDVGRLDGLKNQLEKLKDARSKTKAETDELEQLAIATLMQIGVRYIDLSGNGSGPFYCICKDKSAGSFNRERLLEFFNKIIPEIKANPTSVTSDKCVDLAFEFLGQFEKRKLVLNKLTQVKTRSVDDLREWATAAQK